MLANTFRRTVPHAIALSLWVLFALLAGCSEHPSGRAEHSVDWNAQQQQALEKRVRDRWLALGAHDFSAAWEFTSPNYRAAFPKHLYVKKFSYATEWELTDVKSVNYDSQAAVASVVVRVMSKPTKQTSTASVAIGAIPKNLRERWIFTEGDWWFSANY